MDGRRSALVLTVVLLAGWPSPGRANCARPVGYAGIVAASTVTIRPINFASRGCPDPGGLLRQEVPSGVTVRLADFCEPQAQPGEGRAWLDECVPPGRYRYGFARPYDCVRSACETTYYEEVVVSASLGTGCQRSPGNEGPTAAAGAPWGGSATICTYGGRSWGCASAPPGTGTVFLLDAAVAAIGLAWMGRRRRPKS